MKGRRLEGVAPLAAARRALIALLRADLVRMRLNFARPRHDIPADVKINAFSSPPGDRLELLVRLPLASLIDTDFPMRGAFLDLAAPTSRSAAASRCGPLTGTISTSTRWRCAREAPHRRRAGALPSDRSLRRSKRPAPMYWGHGFPAISTFTGAALLGRAA